MHTLATIIYMLCWLYYTRLPSPSIACRACKNRTADCILFIFQLNASETTEQAMSFSRRKQTESRQCHLDIGWIIVPAARLIKNARSQEVNLG